MTTAYVQQGNQGDPNYLNLERIAYGFWERGYEVIRFPYSDLGEGKFDHILNHANEEPIFAGGVGTIREALRRANRPLPPNIDLPDCLIPWIGRKFWTTSMEAIRNRFSSEEGSEPIHVKPLTHHKIFKGTVVSGFRDLISSAAVEPDFPVLVQEVVEFVSEWRASVFRNKIVNVAHYLGDPLLFPDSELMQAALEAFNDRPIAFAMDWGITASGQTLLIEANDGFALGNYGAMILQYTAMIECRWREMMGFSDNHVGKHL